MSVNRYLPVATAVVLIVVAAIVQGTWTERWGAFPELELYAQQLKNVPMNFGDWTGEPTQDSESNQKILDIAGAVGSLSRVYRNERNEQVSIFMVCGRLDDVFFHTPDRCYPAAGFESSSEITKQSFEVGSEVADFKTSTYLKADPGGNQSLRIYWSFNANGEWIAPEEYRWSFAGQRALYKIYVVTQVTNRDASADSNPAVEFIRAVLPELDKALEPAFAEGRKLSGAASSTSTPVEAEKS